MVLVAHEHEGYGKVFAMVLRKFGGFTTATVNDVDQLLPRAREVRPDLLLISDWFGHAVWSLDPSSYDIVRLLRHDPDFTNLPVVMLCHGMEQAQKAVEAGCTPSIDAFPEELIETVRQLLAARQGRVSETASSP